MNDYSTFLRDDGFIILLFHGVIRRQRYHIRNYTTKHLEVDRFASVLKSLCACGSAVSMSDIVNATLTKQPLPKRAFAITFDDGFENNYSVAAPVLEDFKVPTTFYITTGFIESNGASWIDLIEYAVETTAEFSFDSPYPELNGRYKTIDQKLEFLNQVRQLVKNAPQIDPYEFAEDVSRQIGINISTPDPELDQKMSWLQVRELSQNNLFTIGGHSHTHRILEYLDQPRLEQEIALSLDILQANLKKQIVHYSYPEGLAHCYSDRVISVLRQHGIVCAPSAIHGINRPGDDLFNLKRIMVV